MIATANSNERVLDVSGGNKGNGANVLLWDWHNVAWQKWKVTFDAEGLYTITNVHSGKVLDVSVPLQVMAATCCNGRPSPKATRTNAGPEKSGTGQF